MERITNEDNQCTLYPEDLETISAISSMLAYVQGILSQLKMNNRHKEIYIVDSGQLRQENEVLRKGLSVLKEVMNITLQV
jgi:hypothetical protein